MSALAGTLLSLILPGIAGRLVVRRLWPTAPLAAAWSAGPLVGLGLAGTSFFLGLIVFGSGAGGFVSSEIVLAGITAALLWNARRKSQSETPQVFPRGGLHVDSTLFAVCLLLASAAFIFLASAQNPGGWDAIGIWNMKARFIERGGTEAMTGITDPWLYDTNPGYPLAYPSLVARGWVYTGGETGAVPFALALTFLSTTVGLVVSLTGLAAGRRLAFAAGSVLLGTPFVLERAASLYADVAIAAYATGATLLWSARDDDPGSASGGVPVLAGMMAGFAASTKDEGLLFVLVLFGARFALSVWKADSRGILTDIPRAAAGLVAASFAGALFKLFIAPTNPMMAGITRTFFVDRWLNVDVHANVVRGMWGELANFGSWWLSPVGFLLAYAALGLVSAGRRGIPQIPGLARTSGLVLVGMAAGFHHVYVFSPYDITWHVQSSFTRLVFQFWPIAIVCLLAIGSRSSPGARWTRSTRISTAAAAAAAAGTIALLAARGTLAPAPVPTLEINRTEVVRGADAYTLRIRGMERGIVEVGYRIDGGEEQFMTVRLDESGEIEFDVSDQTPPGTYTFTGVRDTATGAAYEVTGSITVR